MKTINTLPPFKRFCVTIGNLPSSYVDSMSYYECLMWLCKYLKETVIPAVNENAEAVNELINWFNNLDVQEEINTKLDEMVESGELQEIISEYLNSTAIFGFNTLADMKSATNLIDGSYARTMGYHSVNDGGSGLYKIRTVTNDDVVDEGSIVEMSNDNLIAELICDQVNVKQFGAYGDNEHDDTNSISNAFNFAQLKHYQIYLPKGKYIVTSSLPNLNAGSIIYGDEGIGSDGSYGSQIIDNRTTQSSWLIQYYQVDPSHLTNERGTTIRNISFINEDTNNEETKWLINFNYILEDVLIENLYITGYERVFYANDTNYFIFKNIRLIKVGSYANSNKYYAMEFEGLFGSLLDNVQTDKARYMVKIKTRSGGSLGGQIRFTNCHFEQTSNFHCVSSANTESLIYIDTSYTQQFENCMFVPADSSDYSANAPYTIYSTGRILMSNCYFYALNKGLFLYSPCSVSNCEFVNCDFTSIVPRDVSNISNCRFTISVTSDITDYKYIIANAGLKCMPECNNNIMTLAIGGGLTKLTNIPGLYMFNKKYTLNSTSNKYNISQNYQISDKWASMFRIQKTNADYAPWGFYKIKVRSMVNATSFYYEGIIKVESNGTVTKVQTIAQSNIATKPIDIWVKGNDILIQPSVTGNWLEIDVEDLENMPLIAYMDNTSYNVTGYSGHLEINS